MKKLCFLLAVLLVISAFGCNRPAETRRPLIGITTTYNANKQDPDNPRRANTQVGFAYVNAVWESGGIPVVLPTITDEEAIQRYVEVLDGLVAIGGADIPPEVYGQEKHEKTSVLNKERYDFESRLLKAWLAGGKPFLGVCLGMQFFNVMAGGTLLQDIPSMIETDIVHSSTAGAYHWVDIKPDSLLAERLGGTCAWVYSSHHQAVKEVAPGFKVIAYSPDGIIEALERTDGRFGLAVQWHPESMADTHHRKAIYGALVEAARKR